MTNQRDVARAPVGTPDAANACFGPAQDAEEAIEHEGFFSNKMLVSEYLPRMRAIVSSWALFADV